MVGSVVTYSILRPILKFGCRPAAVRSAIVSIASLKRKVVLYMAFRLQIYFIQVDYLTDPYPYVFPNDRSPEDMISVAKRW